MHEKHMRINDLISQTLFAHKELFKDFFESFYKYFGEDKTLNIQNEITVQEYFVPGNRIKHYFFRTGAAQLENDEQINIGVFNNDLEQSEYKSAINCIFDIYRSRLNKTESEFSPCQKVTSIVLVSRGKNKPFIEIYRYKKDSEPYSGKVDMAVINMDNVPNFGEYMDDRIAPVEDKLSENNEKEIDIKVAMAMIKSGESLDKILKYTRLTKEEIEKLAT